MMLSALILPVLMAEPAHAWRHTRKVWDRDAFPLAWYMSDTSEDSLPEELEVTARTDDRQVMAVRHRSNPTWGVQFHPESILSPEGDVLLKNFLKLMERHHEA